tara:strand:+ start:910 stop:1596 length:687 start_codon:yes stop_codon:yes gene_type:complete
MANTNFANIKACVFDAYGTLFDIHSPAEKLTNELGEKAPLLSEIWRQKQLQYTWLRSLMGQHASFWQITGDALDFALQSIEIKNPALRAKLMELYLQLDVYPEVPKTLKKLKDSNIKTAILSNGEPSMLIAAAKNAGIYELLDVILSVEEVGVFKPHPDVYQIAVDKFKIPPDQMSFQSSNSWDAHGASLCGFSVAWVNRFNQFSEILPAEPHTELNSLSELPELIGL